MKLFASLALALFVACTSSGRAPDASLGTPEPVAVATTPAARFEPALAPDVVDAPAPGALPDVSAGKLLAPAHNAFGFDLWSQLSQLHSGNLALSPASLSVAFAMTYAGARGATADEMRAVLHLAGIDDPSVGGGALTALWNVGGKDYALRVANRLFGEQTAPFEATFLDLVKSAYGAPLEPVDFVHAFDPARVSINGWVAKRTEDRIKDLLPPGSLDSDTRLVLVNALYFKGAWQSKFDEHLTTTGDFATPAGPKSVPFMRRVGAFDTGKAAGASVLQMPYVGGDLAMTVVVPDGDLAALEASLSQATLDAWVASLHESGELDVKLPRFRIETDSMSLKEELKTLGMKRAFLESADFKGMSSMPSLFIADAFHKVFVEVNEEGTEAAAATAVVMARESAHFPATFHVDKPFLFFVRDLRTGHVMFMGRVTDPSA